MNVLEPNKIINKLGAKWGSLKNQPIEEKMTG